MLGKICQIGSATHCKSPAKGCVCLTNCLTIHCLTKPMLTPGINKTSALSELHYSCQASPDIITSVPHQEIANHGWVWMPCAVMAGSATMCKYQENIFRFGQN